MANYISIIISVLALILSLIQFIGNNDRNKKEATLNAYKALQKEFVEIKSVKDRLKIMQRDSEDWLHITTCLANIENFCVGINTGIYDIKVLNRLGGGFFIEQYRLLEPVIQKKQEKESSIKLYTEFQETVKNLQKMRK